jgi:uncharacterized repeat protein (TIGR03843 family)
MPQANNLSMIELLEHGEITVRGKFLWGSNFTFLVDVARESELLKAVYKPTRGERPLWDFPPSSLAHREVAAYLVSEGLGWGLVPETIYRRKGPVGAGSLQRYIEHDPDNHFFNFSPENRQRLRAVVVFDLLINNADRKGGHVILTEDDQIWLIDHGVCFHTEDKLRTVLWDFAGEEIPQNLLTDLACLVDQLRSGENLSDKLSAHLSRGELRALARRAEQLIETAVFPDPDPDRRPYPWPPV